MKTSLVLKRRFAKEGKGMSLKEFVRSLLQSEKDGADLLAKDWFAHKLGSLNTQPKADRLTKKGAKIAAEKSATKQARTKGKR